MFEFCNMHVKKCEHACSSFEHHAKFAIMLTWDFFKISCSEWNMHVPHVEHGKISCQHAAPFPDGLYPPEARFFVLLFY